MQRNRERARERERKRLYVRAKQKGYIWTIKAQKKRRNKEQTNRKVKEREK